MNTAKAEMRVAEEDKAEKDAAVVAAQAAFDSKAAEFTAKVNELTIKQAELEEKEDALSQVQANIQSLTTEIADLNAAIQQKEALISQKTAEKETEENKIATYTTEKESHEGRVEEMNAILEAEGNSLLFAKDMAIIKAFENNEVLSEQNPYKASDSDAGRFGVTKNLIEEQNHSVTSVEFLANVMVAVGIILLLGALMATFSEMRD